MISTEHTNHYTLVAGYCLSCGERTVVVPGAERVECPSCGHRMVYDAYHVSTSFND